MCEQINDHRQCTGDLKQRDEHSLRCRSPLLEPNDVERRVSLVFTAYLHGSRRTWAVQPRDEHPKGLDGVGEALESFFDSHVNNGGTVLVQRYKGGDRGRQVHYDALCEGHKRVEHGENLARDTALHVLKDGGNGREDRPEHICCAVERRG